MKPFAFSIAAFLLSVSVNLSGQQIPLRLDAIEKGTGRLITMRMISRDGRQPVLITATDQQTGQQIKLSPSELKKYDMMPADVEALWQHSLIEARVYSNLLTGGYQYERRYEMDELMREFMSRAEQNSSFYIDSYLESRLYGILRKVYPVRNSDKRPGIISLRIFSDIVPDAWVGPDGTLIITTGVITALGSEDELMALMAQRMAHYALDHHLSLYLDLYRSETEPALGNIIRFTAKQEQEADVYTIPVLKFNGRDSSHLAVMLQNVLAYGELMGNYYLGEEKGFFPNAARRSAYVPAGSRGRSRGYEEMIADVISFNAYNAYIQSQYLLSRSLLERKVALGNATADDLVLLSQALLRLSGSAEDDEKALTVVRGVTAVRADAPAAAFKQEALILMRLGRNGEAETALDGYVAALGADEQKYRSMAGDWSQMLTYIESEKEWVRKILSR